MKTLLVQLVRIYRVATSWTPSPCRYQPTCSAYAIEAIEGHGAIRGSMMAARRIFRCHPWHAAGYDPVPPIRPPASGVETEHGTT